MGNTMKREAELLEAMKYATLDEQKWIAAELDALRAAESANFSIEREADLADAIVRDHLTPVLVHTMHGASTDWLGEISPEYTTADLGKITNTMRTEATLWFNSLSEGVLANRDELAIQADGAAQHIASQYGELAEQARSGFMSHVAHLYRTAEGTDLGTIPSAAGDSSNPDLAPWGDVEALPPAGPVDYTAPPGLDVGTPQPDPTAGTLGTTTPESAESPVTTQSAPEEMAPEPESVEADVDRRAYARYDYDGPVYQRGARRLLATEEGQTPPTPGEVDPEQDGEAASSLPVSVDWNRQAETFENFMPPTAPKPAPSTRAPNVTGAQHVAVASDYKCSCGKPATHVYIQGPVGSGIYGSCDEHPHTLEPGQKWVWPPHKKANVTGAQHTATKWYVHHHKDPVGTASVHKHDGDPQMSDKGMEGVGFCTGPFPTRAKANTFANYFNSTPGKKNFASRIADARQYTAAHWEDTADGGFMGPAEHYDPVTTPQYYDANGTPCTKCGKGINELSGFPGGLCINCWSNSDEGRYIPTSDELTRMWGGPARHTSRKDGQSTECPECGCILYGDDPEMAETGRCPECADPYSDYNRAKNASSRTDEDGQSTDERDHAETMPGQPAYDDTWQPEGWDTDDVDRKQASRRTAVATGPNPQGSFVYDPAKVHDKGYAEGMYYALRWEPGKPVPAAMSSAASIGDKYNVEYVAGYQAGVNDGIGKLSTEFQTAWASAHRQQVLSSRKESYKIVRRYFNERSPRTIKRGLTLEDAQAHCQREDTHGGSTDDGSAWFDGYTREDHDAALHTTADINPTNETRTLTLPYSEVCMSMGVAGKTMKGQLTNNGYGVQLFNDDGSMFSFPITQGEAGWDLVNGEDTRYARRVTAESCKHCGESIHSVPGGRGSVWVNPDGYHSCRGIRDASGKAPQTHEPGNPPWHEAALPQLQLADMDQTPSNPGMWDQGGGAADVANVPTPGQGVADYPQPQGGAASAPAVGTGAEVIEPVIDEVQAQAFRQTIQANLRLEANQYIRKTGDSWVIISKHTGKPISHHTSKEKAEEAFRGMEMNMHGGSLTASKSRNCTNGNHSDCKGCGCSCHSKKNTRSGACADGDHKTCKMGSDCSCRCHKKGS